MGKSTEVSQVGPGCWWDTLISCCWSINKTHWRVTLGASRLKTCWDDGGICKEVYSLGCPWRFPMGKPSTGVPSRLTRQPLAQVVIRFIERWVPLAVVHWMMQKDESHHIWDKKLPSSYCIPPVLSICNTTSVLAGREIFARLSFFITKQGKEEWIWSSEAKN